MGGVDEAGDVKNMGIVTYTVSSEHRNHLLGRLPLPSWRYRLCVPFRLCLFLYFLFFTYVSLSLS